MNDQTTSYHAPVTTLEELDALDDDELFAGHMSGEKGDPEPGANHTRSFHHGWRTRMMDLHEIEITPEHRKLTSEWVARNRAKECKSHEHRQDDQARAMGLW